MTMEVEPITIEVSDWDQIVALDRVIMALGKSLELTDRSEDFYEVLQKDVACLILLREELKEAIEADGDLRQPH